MAQRLRTHRRAGALKDAITIQQKTKTKDAFKDATEAWTTFAEVNADIITIASTKTGSDQVETGSDQYRVELRYIADVTKEMQIVWGSKTLDITGFDNDLEHRGWMVIFAQEQDL